MATVTRRKVVDPLAETLRAPLYPNGAGSGGDRIAADGSITTRRKTAVENARIAEFDRSMGFSDPAARTNFAAAAASDRAARLKKDPYDIGPYASDTTGTFASQRAPEIVGGKNGAPAYQSDARGVVTEVPKAVAVSPVNRTDGMAPRNSAALDLAGSRVGGVPAAPTPAAAPMAGPLSQVAYQPSGPGFTPLPTPTYQTNTATPSAVPAPSAAPATPTATPAPTPTAVVSAESPGRSTAAGVSNSQAAQFTQPTADKPVPETPTSPVMNVDDYDKKKQPFAGF